nr:MAG TPA: hypothetical protein [Caudoviricetes sp.]
MQKRVLCDYIDLTNVLAPHGLLCGASCTGSGDAL